MDMFGIDIIEDHNLVIFDGLRPVKRSFKERLFSLPWMPLKKYRYVPKYKPADYAIKMCSGSKVILVAHPVFVNFVKENINNPEFTIKYKEPK